MHSNFKLGFPLHKACTWLPVFPFPPSDGRLCLHLCRCDLLNATAASQLARRRRLNGQRRRQNASTAVWPVWPPERAALTTAATAASLLKTPPDKRSPALLPCASAVRVFPGMRPSRCFLCRLPALFSESRGYPPDPINAAPTVRRYGLSQPS